MAKKRNYKSIKSKKIADPKAKYDVLKNTGKRKSMVIETQGEDDIHSRVEKLRSINLVRDLHRNHSHTRAMIKQFQDNVIGWNGGKLRLNIDSENRKPIEKWFNSIWSKNCDARAFETFNSLLKLSESTLLREGCFLCVFDDFMENDGKLFFFESDQLVSLIKKDWEQYAKANNFKDKQGTIYNQKEGIITDKMGRVKGYIASYKHGLDTAKIDDVTIFTIDSARLIQKQWRFNQKKGDSQLITVAADLEDINEIKQREIQSLKASATILALYNDIDILKDSITRTGVDPEKLLTPEEEGGASDTANIAMQQLAQNFTENTGGLMIQVADEKSITFPKIDRPSLTNLPNFYDFILGGAGASIGLPHLFTTLKGEKSYTAARAEMLIAETTFKNEQKFIETFCDWIARKSINWAMKKGVIPKIKLDDWQYKISWIFPKLKSLKPLDDEKQTELGLKNGTLTFADLLGADYEEKLIQLAKEIEKIRALNLPLNILEMKSGGMSDNSDDLEDLDEKINEQIEDQINENGD